MRRRVADVVPGTARATLALDKDELALQQPIAVVPAARIMLVPGVHELPA